MASGPLHICHLSLLNPAIHSRIFFKMALSQVQAGYRVTIIAQDPARAPYFREGVEIVPLGVFGRLSWRRLWSLGRMRRLAQGLAADVYQIHTVELLGIARKLKQRMPRAKVIYDVHEDYVGNIMHADYYTEWTRPKLAAKVRVAQEDFTQWGDGVIYAEDCFAGIMAFDPQRTAIVRNKFRPPQAVPPPVLTVRDSSLPMMLYTGTIAENWGVLRAVELWRLLNASAPLNLVIAGHGQDAKLMAMIRGMVAASGLQDRFMMAGGDTYLPYEDLVALIPRCTFGVALYDLKKNIEGRIPTKFYEFMAHGKPLIFTQNPAWDALNAQWPFGRSMTWPPSSDILTEILYWMESRRSPFQSPPPQAWSWESEAPIMLDLLRKLTS